MTQRNKVLEQQVVDYIVEHTERHGYPPSMRQIAARIDRSKSHAHQVVRRLAEEGILEVVPKIRSVRVKSAVMKARDEYI